MSCRLAVRGLALAALFCLSLPAAAAAGGMEDDPLLVTVVMDQLEYRLTSGADPLVWDGEAWIGHDRHKLWLKSSGEYHDGRAGELELQALYSRAVAPFWDLQVGWRHDARPRPQRDWLALGIKGIAPYLFDMDAAVFLGDSGRAQARIQAEYEILFTQRLILVPEVEVNLASKNDEATATGAGLVNLEAGARLRYEISRRFAPYVGLTWSRLYGDTADFAAAEGGDPEEHRAVLGLRIWY